MKMRPHKLAESGARHSTHSHPPLSVFRGLEKRVGGPLKHNHPVARNMPPGDAMKFCQDIKCLDILCPDA